MDRICLFKRPKQINNSHNPIKYHKYFVTKHVTVGHKIHSYYHWMARKHVVAYWLVSCDTIDCIG